jgi:hypothetical protein
MTLKLTWLLSIQCTARWYVLPPNRRNMIVIVECRRYKNIAFPIPDFPCASYNRNHAHRRLLNTHLTKTIINVHIVLNQKPTTRNKVAHSLSPTTTHRPCYHTLQIPTDEYLIYAAGDLSLNSDPCCQSPTSLKVGGGRSAQIHVRLRVLCLLLIYITVVKYLTVVRKVCEWRNVDRTVLLGKELAHLLFIFTLNLRAAVLSHPSCRKA